MASHLKNHTICIIFPLTSLTSSPSNTWTRDKISTWIQNAGGTLASSFSSDVTHVVCEEKAWRNEVMSVKLAKEAKAAGRKVKVVSPSWLEDTLREQKRVREGAYLWEKLDKGRDVSGGGASEVGRKGKGDAGKELGEEGGPRSVPGLMGEAFLESTEFYLSERDRRKLEAEAEGRARVQREVEAEERQREEQRKRLETGEKRQEALERRRAVRKGRSELFTDHHHVWTDSTGFKHDIMLTKVDTLRNVNERITLTVFESNAEPKTYATNLYFAGTKTKSQNNIIACIGSNLPTAFRLFRKAFREKTGVDWDDRIKAHNERVRANEAGGRDAREGESVEWERRCFQYVPPQFGGEGVLPPKHGLTLEAARATHNARTGETVVLDDDPDQEQEKAVQSAERAEGEEERGTVNASAPLGVNGQPAFGSTSFFDEAAQVPANSIDANHSFEDVMQQYGQPGKSMDIDFTQGENVQGESHQQFEFGDSNTSAPMASFASVAGQTQMAEQVGQDFLNFEGVGLVAGTGAGASGGAEPGAGGEGSGAGGNEDGGRADSPLGKRKRQ